MANCRRRKIVAPLDNSRDTKPLSFCEKIPPPREAQNRKRSFCKVIRNPMADAYFSKHAERDLKHLPPTAYNALRNTHLPALAKNPRAGKMLHGPLRGYFSFDFWSGGVSYRIAYEIIKGDVVILIIDTRDNFYKKFSRRVL